MNYNSINNKNIYLLERFIKLNNSKILDILKIEILI